MSFPQSLARRAVERRLGMLRRGRLTLVDGSSRATWGAGSDAPLTITVHDPRLYAAIAFGGAVGAGEAYAAGWWDTDDLTGVIRLLLRNRNVMTQFEAGWAAPVQWLRRAWHAARANSRRGARHNIREHYDLGNNFFELILDETLTYSCGLFQRPGMTLAEASCAKYDRIAALLDLGPDDHVVEIGTGWGGFALHAAARYGCRVTTTTISAEQHAIASERIAAAGLTDRVTLLQQDYRDLRGTFDKLVSIEMIEAVGHEHYDQYFATCARLLTLRGRAVIQAITIADDRYDGARREVDFIKRHIFPGSCIPSRAVMARAAERTDLTLVGDDEIGMHYAETLRRWREALFANADAIEALGFDRQFQRLWDFYFCYCEGGFLERAIGTAQLTYVKPAATRVVSRDVPAVARELQGAVA